VALSDEERAEVARAVVYNDAGELIKADVLPEVVEAAGVTVVEADDEDSLEYRDVPADLPLAACHLAVDFRKDLAVVLSLARVD